METDKTNKKIMTVSFVAAGALAYLIVTVMFTTLAASFSIVERLRSNALVVHAVPVIAAFAVFAALQFNERIQIFTNEVVTEVRKIVWPSQRDTVSMTIAVCVMLILAALVLMLLDYASSILIKWIIHS